MAGGLELGVPFPKPFYYSTIPGAVCCVPHPQQVKFSDDILVVLVLFQSGNDREPTSYH